MGRVRAWFKLFSTVAILLALSSLLAFSDFQSFGPLDIEFSTTMALREGFLVTATLTAGYFSFFIIEGLSKEKRALAESGAERAERSEFGRRRYAWALAVLLLSVIAGTLSIIGAVLLETEYITSLSLNGMPVALRLLLILAISILVFLAVYGWVSPKKSPE